jgi:hypothetical protein
MRRRLFIPLIALLAMALAPSVARADFGFEPGSTTVQALDGEGRPVTQAGAHPSSFVIEFALNEEAGGTGKVEGGEMRQLEIELPPGLVGDPEAVPPCKRQEFEGTTPQCSGASQVGVLLATSPSLGQTSDPIYEIEPPVGQAAQLGFSAFNFLIQQNASVRTDDGYGISVAAPVIPIEIGSVKAVIWGNPADPSHDSERTCTVVGKGHPIGCGAGIPVEAFLTLPRSCEVFTMRINAESRSGIVAEEAAVLRDGGGNPTPLTGCESVPFGPSVTATPAPAGESASGLAFSLKLPDEGLTEPKAIAEDQPLKTEVTLPIGMTVNPSAASGIGVCSISQYEGAACPESSKLGTLVANTPLLSEPIAGSVYLAAPHANPFNSLLAIYIVAEAKQRGVLVKQAGQIQADPTTGQLTATFDHLPPLPYSSFEFNLREGPRAPLITPQACGEYNTVAKLYPFSAPGSPVIRTTPFKIASNAGGPCVSGEGQAPSRPSFEAGTVAPLAATYSPFVFRVKRNDGEQRFSSLQATLPTGLLGRIAGVPFCPESGIATAGSRTEEGAAAAENASPSCPASSRVGVVNVAAGAGSQPYYVQGKAYLAGPYKGSPLSLEIITPAIAGPFDLGSVAVRTALYVNEVTAQIHAVSDPLPSILHGIPLDVRTISLQMDKPEFTLNPTNCQAKTVTGAISTLTGASSALSQPFAVGGCKGLAFKPELKLAFTGQIKRLGNPAIKAVLTQPKGQNANVSGATVILPKGMFIDQAHISNPCTRVQFNSTRVPGAGCPAKSILGTAKVWTPLLGAPEEGKVYFRSNGGERELPDLAVALRGQIPLQLLGFIDSVGKKGAEVRRVRSRFLSLPDAPVSRFELKLFGGKKGLLENSKSLCELSGKAKFQLTGQNGATHDTEPKVQVKCGKKGSGKKASSGAGKK